MDKLEILFNFLENLRILVRWFFASCFFVLFLTGFYGKDFFSLFERTVLVSMAIFGIGYFITLPRKD